MSPRDAPSLRFFEEDSLRVSRVCWASLRCHVLPVVLELGPTKSRLSDGRACGLLAEQMSVPCEINEKSAMKSQIDGLLSRISVVVFMSSNLASARPWSLASDLSMAAKSVNLIYSCSREERRAVRGRGPVRRLFVTSRSRQRKVDRLSRFRYSATRDPSSLPEAFLSVFSVCVALCERR